MNVSLRYGTTGLEVDLPAGEGFRGVIEPLPVPAIRDPEQQLYRLLVEPTLGPSLAGVAAGRRNAVIVISDITRPVPNRRLLPPVLDTLHAAGLSPERVQILIATGIHRPCTPAEIERLVGAEIAGRYAVINHDSRNTTDMRHVMDIHGDVPVWVNRHYLAADLKILTGFIEPHMWAGYSGGRKSVLPGICAVDTLQYMHGPAMIAHPGTVYGRLEGNPFHEAGLAVLARCGADFLINVTLDAAHQITGIFTGHPVEAHRAGCDFLAPRCTQRVTEPLDFIVTTNAGAPLDCNLYQTVKGMAAAIPALRPGGTILIASACAEGLGSDDYCRVLDKVTDPGRFLDELMAGRWFIPDQWCAQETYQIVREYPVWLYTDGISAETVRRLHLRPVDSISEAVTELLGMYGPMARWAVVPDGPMVILGRD
ncbi:MAG: nickel-dependent lactate racemase [Acidobacteria bacterium]|nr:nickel-dependent lactate racemase [Acidobacteriota bacterium]